MITLLLSILLSACSCWGEKTFLDRMNYSLSCDVDSLVHVHAIPVFKDISSGEVFSDDSLPVVVACLLAPLDGEYSETTSYYLYRILANQENNQRQIKKAIYCLPSDRKEKAIKTLSILLHYEYSMDHAADDLSTFRESFKYLYKQGYLLLP